MRIALDAFGSDRAPHPEIEGAVMAIKEDLCGEVILVGDESVLSAELSSIITIRADQDTSCQSAYWHG